MIPLPANVDIFLADQPADFRKSFDGLSAIVLNQFGIDPMSGHLFVFLNRRQTQVKMLFWERNGLCLVSKRLEKGTFKRIRSQDEQDDDAPAKVQIDAAQLAMLLEGIDMAGAKRRKRYIPTKSSAA